MNVFLKISGLCLSVAALLGAVSLASCGGPSQGPSFTPQATRTHHHTAGQMTLYNLPYGPLGITVGPDGALWAVQTYPPSPYNSHIARVATDGTVTEYPLGFADALFAATGSDGALWITGAGPDNGGLNLGRLPIPSGNFTDYGTQWPNNGLYGEALGPDGDMWISSTENILRADTNGVVTGYALPDQVQNRNYGQGGAQATDIALGPDGAFWITVANYPYGHDYIVRMTTDQNFTIYQLPEDGTPFTITTGPDGAMWFTEYRANKVGRIDMSGNFTVFPLDPYCNALPEGIATGPDGNLWIPESGCGSIARVTTSGTVTEFPVPYNYACYGTCPPHYITAGPDGAMWFTAGQVNAQLGVVGRISVDGSSKRRAGKHPALNRPSLGARLPITFARGSIK